MQKRNYLILLCIFFTSFFSCSFKKDANALDTNIVADTVIIRDTIYIDKESSIDDDLYFSISSIYSDGGCWEKEHDDEYWYYYKILFSSIEERNYIYVEEIQIIGDSNVKMIKRTKISPKVFGRDSDYYYYPPKFIDWISPTVVKLLIEEKEYNLDISKMKVVK
jgi:hypothetical protein